MDRLLRKLRSSVQPHHILIAIGVVFGFVILSALWGGKSAQSVDADIGTGKKDFYIQTKRIRDFGQSVILEKPGLIKGAQEITVNAQVAGRVSQIMLREGQSVNMGQGVVALADTNNYRLNLERARIGLERAQLNYNTTKANLDKQQSDFEIALERAQNDYSTLQRTTQLAVEKASQDYKNAQFETTGSLAYLSLQKTELDTTLALDKLKQNFAVEKNNLIKLMETVVQQSDVLLGLTENYRNLNNGYELYLGISDLPNKSATESFLLKAYVQMQIVNALPTANLTDAQLVSSLDILNASYALLSDLLKGVIQVLRTSTADASSFSQTTINTTISTFQGLQTSQQSAFNAFTAYKNSVNSALAQSGSLYSDPTQLQLQTAAKNLEIARKNAEIAYNNAVVSAKDTLFKAESAIKTATANLNNLLQTKDFQLGLLQSSLQEAQVAYSDAARAVSKLNASAPIIGRIGSILVDVGQDVTMGTPLYTIAGSAQQQVEIYIPFDELNLINVGREVGVLSDGKLLSGVVVSISTLADQNLNYKAIIQLLSPVKILGNAVDVHIPIVTRYPLLPLNILRPLDANSAYIYVLGDDNQPLSQRIQIGKVWSDTVEVLTGVTFRDEIIATPLQNYDPAKFNLILTGSVSRLPTVSPTRMMQEE